MTAAPQQAPIAIVRRALLSNLEYLFTSPLGFGVTTATPLQRALCRIIQGVPLGKLAKHPDVISCIGNTSSIDGVKPDELDLIACIRGAKSMIASAVAVFATQNCDLSLLAAGEIPRFPIVSLAKDNADVVYNHITGTLKASPVLSGLLLDEPTAESIMVRGPNDRPVEIAVVAGAKAGGSLVSRWLIGVLFDEAPRMASSAASAVNLPEQQEAARGRILDGGQLLRIGSPHAPFGVSYNQVRDHWKKPSAELVVIKAPGPTMNPVWWTPARMEKLKKKDLNAYMTDCMAEFRDQTESHFSTEQIEAATRAEPLELPYERRCNYVAAIDPATRNNAWTFVIGTRIGTKRVIACARQWVPKGGPLSIKTTAKEIAKLCKYYHIDTVMTDQWSSDSLREIFAEEGINLVEHRWTQKQTVDGFTKARDKFNLGEIELPNIPQFADDLKRTLRVTTQGGITIKLPETEDGRHCDFAPSFVRVIAHWVDDQAEDVPQQGTPERARHDEAEREKQEDTEFERRSQRPWFRGGPLHGRSLTRR